MASNLRRGRSAFGAPATPTDSLGGREAVCSRAVPHRPGRRRASSTTGVLDLTRAWTASPASERESPGRVSCENFLYYFKVADNRTDIGFSMPQSEVKVRDSDSTARTAVPWHTRNGATPFEGHPGYGHNSGRLSVRRSNSFSNTTSTSSEKHHS
jgi:hypothetical protein